MTATYTAINCQQTRAVVATCAHVYCILLYLIATATITFSKQKDAATKQGQALNLCRIPKQWHLYGTYVLDVTGTN